jgi:O-antigen/teichoic acid export membrane protein
MRKSLASIPKSFKEQIIYSAGIVLTKIVAIIMLPVFTYYLTPADYARLDIIQTLANLASLVVAFGLSDSLFRFAGETSKSEVRTHMAANIFALAIITLFLGALCTQLLAPLISRLLPGEISLFQTRTILASLAVTACISVPLAWLRMQGKAGFFFSCNSRLGYISVSRYRCCFVPRLWCRWCTFVWFILLGIFGNSFVHLSILQHRNKLFTVIISCSGTFWWHVSVRRYCFFYY